MKVASEVAESGNLHHLPSEYLVLMMRSQMEITVEYFNAHPEFAEPCREAGFNMLWRGITGE